MRRSRSIVLVFLLMLTPLSSLVSAEGLPTVSITTDWNSSSALTNEHAYVLTFGDSSSHDYDVSVEHIRDSIDLAPSIQTTFLDNTPTLTARIVLDTTIAWNDTISISVTINGHDGNALQTAITEERTFTVGSWNQPMADHEVTTTTSWSLEQNYQTNDGNQSFMLLFEGNGWQQRIGEVLNAYELGNGTLLTSETTGNSTTELALDFESFWKNETVTSGVLTSQVIQAKGSGDILLQLNEDGLVTTINATVVDALLNRSNIDNVVSERLRLEAFGALLVNGEEDDTQLDVDGDISLLLLETTDVDGVRVLQHTQIEATADMLLSDEGSEFNLQLDQFETLERWENGVRVDQLDLIRGDGTFGFTDQEENSSMVVNGTVYNFHTRVEDGITLIDDVHVDGTLSGDVQGTFGVVQSIEQTGKQLNHTLVEHDVNVIHSETWFNVTGIGGSSFFGGSGAGTYYNDSYIYQATNADWDNRTVRLVWTETGPDPSSGDERPERSPIEQEPTPPEVEEALGNISVGREAGFAPVPMETGDVVRLLAQDGIVLTVTAGQETIEPRDAKNLSVIQWTGVYSDGVSGTASGSIVHQGPLTGLLASTVRSFEIEFGTDGETALLNESQAVDAILSPSIVSADDNTAPQVLDLSLMEGLVFGEGGSPAHLVATIDDPDWNIVSVQADLSSIGFGTVVMNDRGLDGDQTIGDNEWTTMLSVQGLAVGELPISVVVVDEWGETSTLSTNITVENQAPRILSASIEPATVVRGGSTLITLDVLDYHGVASIVVDLREYGGEETPCLKVEVWACELVIPQGMTPGERLLKVRLTDDLGATILVTKTQASEHHFQPSSTDMDLAVTVENTPPSLTLVPSEGLQRGDSDSEQAIEIRVDDPDGILLVRADLGVLKPLGQTTRWVTLYDNGQGLDREANDGIYTAAASV
ncbi:MAG: choice-of-anchor X domain-containing protein, partial [Candidatus Thermoplasmatota archaeon]|nr:choice-of-anchor X domain-containing protein [Candidatus Thermoplasmatota archaeon]